VKGRQFISYLKLTTKHNTLRIDDIRAVCTDAELQFQWDVGTVERILYENAT